MGCIYHNGRFAILQSASVPPKWSHYGLVRLALIELYDPEGPIPSKIDSRCKNWKRLILLEESIPRNGPVKMIRNYELIYKRYKALAIKFERLWPLHSWAKEWPLPREVVFEWPDHLVNQQ